MAITTSARRRVLVVGDEIQAARRGGIRSAVNSLRHFAEIEDDPAGKRTLTHAADVIEQVFLSS